MSDIVREYPGHACFQNSCDYMKVSIITVVLNNKEYIKDCIQSVLSQTYNNIEYIVVDGGSTDGTAEIIKQYEDRISRWISEPDKGIYDAMNKGIALATGDIIGILNADDFYVDKDVVGNVVNEFKSDPIDAVFADLVCIDRNNPEKVVRYSKSSNFSPRKFAYGWMPAHPTVFVKRDCYKHYGLFKTDYLIAADYELLARFIGKYKITYKYIPKVIVKMRTGGRSTKNFKSNWILNREIIRACAENGIKTDYLKVYSKYFIKVFELWERPE